MYKRLAMYVRLISVLLLFSSLSFGESGKLINSRQVKSEAHTSYGCAANCCYVILTELFPERDIRFGTVEAALPLTRACTGKEIVSFLRMYPVRVTAKELLSKDAIPPLGGWNIIYSKGEGSVGHWYAIARTESGEVWVYGKNNPYEMKKYSFAEADKRLRERFELGKRSGVSIDDMKVIVIEIRRRRVSVHVALILAAIAITAIIAFLFKDRVNRSRCILKSASLVVLVITPFIASCSKASPHPVISVTDPRRELGLLVWDSSSARQERREVFSLRNVGGAPLEIEELRASCTCTKTEVSRKLIPPGEEATVTLSIALEQGLARTVNAAIYSNDPKSPEVISVSYAMMPLWTITPGSLAFEIPEGSAVTQERETYIDIAFDQAEKFAFREVQVADNNLNVKLVGKSLISRKTTEDSSKTSEFVRYTFKISPAISTEMATIANCRADFIFSGDLMLQQNVTVKVRHALRAIPETLVARKDGKSAKGSFILVADKSLGDRLTIEAITCDRLHLDYEVVKESETQSESEMTIRFVFPEVPEEPYNGAVEIQLKGREETKRSLSVPLFIM